MEDKYIRDIVQSNLSNRSESKIFDLAVDTIESIGEGKSTGEGVANAAMKYNNWTLTAEGIKMFTDYTKENEIRSKLVNCSFDEYHKPLTQQDRIKSNDDWEAARQLVLFEEAGTVVSTIKKTASDWIDRGIEYVSSNSENIKEFLAKSHELRTGMHTDNEGNIHVIGMDGRCYHIGTEVSSSLKEGQIGETETITTEKLYRPMKQSVSNLTIRPVSVKKEIIQKVDRVEDDEALPIIKNDYDNLQTSKLNEPVQTKKELIEEDSLGDKLMNNADLNFNPNLGKLSKSSISLSTHSDKTNIGVDISPKNMKSSSLSVMQDVDGTGIGATVPFGNPKKSRINISTKMSKEASISASINPKNPLKSNIGGSVTVPVYGVPVTFSGNTRLMSPENAKLAISIPTGIPGMKTLTVVSISVKKIRHKVGRVFGHKKKKKANRRLKRVISSCYSTSIYYNYERLKELEAWRPPEYWVDPVFENEEVCSSSQDLRSTMQETCQLLDQKLHVSEIYTHNVPICTDECCEEINQNITTNTNFTDQLRNLRDIINQQCQLLLQANTTLNTMVQEQESIGDLLQQNQTAINNLNSVVNNLFN
jgi:hypothetical protein